MNLVPAGYYRAVAVKTETDQGDVYVQFGQTKEGNDQVAVNFELLDGGDYAGTILPWLGFFTEKSEKRTLESLRLLGWKGDNILAVNDQTLENEVSVTVEHDNYEGKVRARVAWVNRPGGGGMKLAAPMDDKGRRAFAERMRSVARGTPEVAGKKADRTAPRGPTPEPGAPVGDQSDPGNRIPF